MYAKDAMVENIDKLIDRERKLNIVVTKAEDFGKITANINNFVIFNE
jgi:hypothetical protein